MNQGEVVIIGGIIIGSSVGYHLYKAGWTGITVIDKGPLPYSLGSTSHAPGGIGLPATTRPSLAWRNTPQIFIATYGQPTTSTCHTTVKEV